MRQMYNEYVRHNSQDKTGAVQPSAVERLVGHAFQQTFIEPRFTVRRHHHVRFKRISVLNIIRLVSIHPASVVGRLVTEIQTTCLLWNPVQGIAWAGPFTSTYSAHPDVETAVESVTIVVSSEPVSRPGSLSTAERCRWPSTALVPPSATPPSPDPDPCAHFRHVAALRRRTHPFYVDADLQSSSRSPDVTLATQLTVDRFAVLERMLTNWPGPASVTLHVRDAELPTVTSVIRSSTTLRRRTNVAFHVVYQRQAYNPINYLRNVAINNSRTAYTFYVDVDLVPGPAVYDTLCRRVAELHRNNRRNVALVVPSFEAFTDLPKLPEDKSELLNLMAANKVAGYR